MYAGGSNYLRVQVHIVAEFVSPRPNIQEAALLSDGVSRPFQMDSSS